MTGRPTVRPFLPKLFAAAIVAWIAFIILWIHFNE